RHKRLLDAEKGIRAAMRTMSVPSPSEVILLKRIKDMIDDRMEQPDEIIVSTMEKYSNETILQKVQSWISNRLGFSHNNIHIINSRNRIKIDGYSFTPEERTQFRY